MKKERFKKAVIVQIQSDARRGFSAMVIFSEFVMLQTEYFDSVEAAVKNAVKLVRSVVFNPVVKIRSEQEVFFKNDGR